MEEFILCNDKVYEGDQAVDYILKLEKQLEEAKEIITLLHEKESSTTLKSKCWQLADKFLKKGK